MPAKQHNKNARKPATKQHRRRVNVPLTDAEQIRLKRDAREMGLKVADYVRRKVFGLRLPGD
jgi:hypothetical protein